MILNTSFNNLSNLTMAKCTRTTKNILVYPLYRLYRNRHNGGLYGMFELYTEDRTYFVEVSPSVCLSVCLCLSLSLSLSLSQFVFSFLQLRCWFYSWNYNVSLLTVWVASGRPALDSCHPTHHPQKRKQDTFIKDCGDCSPQLFLTYKTSTDNIIWSSWNSL